MMRIVRWLIGLPIILIVLCFALINRGDVVLSFWPSDLTVSLPLSLLIIGVFFAGAFLGQLLAWLASLGSRIEAARLRRALHKLQGDKNVFPPDGSTSLRLSSSVSHCEPSSFIKKLKGVFKK